MHPRVFETVGALSCRHHWVLSDFPPPRGGWPWLLCTAAFLFLAASWGTSQFLLDTRAKTRCPDVREAPGTHAFHQVVQPSLSSPVPSFPQSCVTLWLYGSFHSLARPGSLFLPLARKNVAPLTGTCIHPHSSPIAIYPFAASQRQKHKQKDIKIYRHLRHF